MLADGRRYEGDWGDSQWNEKGIMTYADGRFDVGVWRDDELV